MPTADTPRKVLLVYPQYPDTFWSYRRALRFIGRKASLPPMGLLTVAALLPKSWDLRFVDANFTPLRDEDLRWADLVFISAMTVQKESAHEIIGRCKARGVKVVAGGPLFTALSAEFPEVDHLVLDEAELSLPPFLADLEAGSLQRIYRSEGWADLSTTPIPAWDLIDLKKYATMSVQYSRGCPFDCEFCDITVLYGRAPRTKPAANVLAELDALYERGWRGAVFFVDDNFIGNKRTLKADLMPKLIGWMQAHRHPFNFLTQVSINLAGDDELIELMVDAGFDMVFVGIETPDEQSLIECGKMQNTRSDMLADVHKLHSAGLQVQAGFIVGFDSDKLDIFGRISRFINESGIVASMVGLLNAPPNTRLYKRLLSENRILKGISGSNTDFSINFLPRMDKSALVEGYRRIIHDIYRPEAYYSRVRAFLRHYNPRNRFNGGRFSLAHARGFLLSVWRLGIRKGVRRHYWRLFLWTLFRRPRLIPYAITMAIYGDHFMKHFGIVAE
ncbi:B12-binding domain-containing radical SAM protein [bacterium]|nr:B12-binding domain-containing radical SAM protein [bacterium]